MTDTGTAIVNFRILFVDNSRTTRAAMSKLLEEKGYEVTCSGTGMEAIEMVKTGAFNLVIMDLYMPLMNGYEAAKAIRELEGFKDIPIVALTASSDEKDLTIAAQNGMNEFIVKSSDHNNLFNILEKYHKK